MPNLLLSFLATTALSTVMLSVTSGFARLLANAPAWLPSAVFVAGIFGLVWALAHEAVADRLGR